MLWLWREKHNRWLFFIVRAFHFKSVMRWKSTANPLRRSLSAAISMQGQTNFLHWCRARTKVFIHYWQWEQKRHRIPCWIIQCNSSSSNRLGYSCVLPLCSAVHLGLSQLPRLSLDGTMGGELWSVLRCIPTVLVIEFMPGGAASVAILASETSAYWSDMFRICMRSRRLDQLNVIRRLCRTRPNDRQTKGKANETRTEPREVDYKERKKERKRRLFIRRGRLFIVDLHGYLHDESIYIWRQQLEDVWRRPRGFSSKNMTHSCISVVR